MDIDSEMVPDEDPPATKVRTPVNCRDRRPPIPNDAAESRGGGEHSRRCTTEPVERLPGVPCTTNPKPRAPVATRVRIPPTRCSTASHEWRIVSANGYARRYLCACGIEVREKKQNGFWVSVRHNIGQLREPNRAHPYPAPSDDDPHPQRTRRISSLSTVLE